MLVSSAAPAPGRPALRAAALAWALLHVPLFLFLYAPSISAAVHAAPPAYRLALWPTFLPQALLLALAAFLLALPASPWPRAYRLLAPGVAGLGTAALALDSQVYGAVGFHLNGFFFQVLTQPRALKETGVAPRDIALFAAMAVAFVALDTLAGAWFVARFARPGRRAWRAAAAILLLAGAERVYGQALTHFGGPAIFAASGVLPLQPPIRMGKIADAIFGKRNQDPFAHADAMRLPAGLDPKEIRFTRKPDVVFVTIESTPHDHLDARTMPNVWRRAEAGARFTNHSSTASATHYAIFSLVYSIQAQKLEATVGAGRRPMLFPAFKENGYDVRMLAASCVDWMNLKQTVFGGAGSDLETWCDTDGLTADREMVKRAEAIAAATPPDQPLFLFVFFVGPHFDYPYEPQDRVFVPEWDGHGSVKATTVAGALIKNRARNALHTVDRRIEELLSSVERSRGKAPLVFLTADHGEEFRQKGHIAHGSDVNEEQIHVPAAIFGPGVPRGVFDAPTSHVDAAPTLFALLGDTHPPALYSDGMDMFESPPDRFVVATVGWEPRYAVIGKDLKVRMYAGLGSAEITDPSDRRLPDGPERLAANAGKIMRALRGEPAPVA
uniref:sulfatase-like hydrolase/transferase n=1 Tax=Anaeromyxobacter oryzisoli TaxID=2925408 RepID=UPI001F57B7E3